jgi:hypothetical protein
MVWQDDTDVPCCNQDLTEIRALPILKSCALIVVKQLDFAMKRDQN